VCGFGVSAASGEDRPLITPPALAHELSVAAKEGRIYGRVEGMEWFIRDAHTPPLVTVGNPADAVPGALGQPGTAIVFGGNIDTGMHAGAQFTLGYWFNNSKEVGLEASYWYLARRSAQFGIFGGANGLAIIARPFFDANLQIENADVVAVPGVQQGFTNQRLTDRLNGGEFNLLVGAMGDTWYHIGLIAGVRIFHLDEDLEMLTITQALPLPPVTISDAFSETFHTSNQYAGGQIGIDLALRNESWVWDFRGTASIGGNWEEANINGLAQHFDTDTGFTTGPGGLYAQPTNIGNHHRGSFAFFGEIGTSLTYWWTEWFNMRIGYRFLYLSAVARPGDQIDRVVSIQPIGGGPILGVNRPAFSFHETEFWAHGVNFGCELRF
jgi:hypothetical protein